MLATKPIKQKTATEIIKLFHSSKSSQVHILCQRLQENGIDARAVGTHLDDGLYGIGGTAQSEIWVSKKQFQLAEDLLAKWGVGKNKPSYGPITLKSALMFMGIAVTFIAVIAVFQSFIF